MSHDEKTPLSPGPTFENPCSRRGCSHVFKYSGTNPFEDLAVLVARHAPYCDGRIFSATQRCDTGWEPSEEILNRFYEEQSQYLTLYHDFDRISGMPPTFLTATRGLSRARRQRRLLRSPDPRLRARPSADRLEVETHALEPAATAAVAIESINDTVSTKRRKKATSPSKPRTSRSPKPPMRQIHLLPRKKKGARTEAQRRAVLTNDVWTTAVAPHEVRCRGCKSTIKLDGRSRYYPGLWEKHRLRCEGVKKGTAETDASSYSCPFILGIRIGGGKLIDEQGPVVTILDMGYRPYRTSGRPSKSQCEDEGLTSRAIDRRRYTIKDLIAIANSVVVEAEITYSFPRSPQKPLDSLCCVVRNRRLPTLLYNRASNDSNRERSAIPTPDGSEDAQLRATRRLPKENHNTFGAARLYVGRICIRDSSRIAAGAVLRHILAQPLPILDSSRRSDGTIPRIPLERLKWRRVPRSGASQRARSAFHAKHSEALTGFFAQDDLLADAAVIGALRALNAAGASTGTAYKLLFFGRHGQGYHNVAEDKYGTQAWDDYWSKRDGDGEITWGPDPELTHLGIAQAAAANEMWKAELRDARIPRPDIFLCSPLTRTVQTAVATFVGVFDTPRVIVVENCREEHGVHTCDKRSTRTHLEAVFSEDKLLHFEFQPTFAETDVIWHPDLRETHAQVAERARKVLDGIFAEDGEQLCTHIHHRPQRHNQRVPVHMGRARYMLPTGGVLPVVVKATKTS
ncbi:hypothetical protein B0H12DRAFT_1223836 [Mycena haematopus]|nr:hypothetical protein B0H12DRAFT_1223836 [Mycena haematopus]